MEANDIIVSLHMHKIPSFLIEATSQALNERDAALAVLEEWQEISSAINCAIDDVGILRTENERLYNEIGDTEALKVENARLTAAIEAATGECIVDLPVPDTDNARLLLANKAMARENERLTNALNMLRTSITQAPGIPTQENNWMLGIIDTALGDGPAADRPHPLAPVEVD